MSLEVYDSIAVRYRPRVLEDMIGQDKIVKSIKGMIKSGRINRTFLCSGGFGCGKTTLARIIARYLNCKNPKEDGSPCDQCPSCIELSKLNPKHSDYQEINAGDARGIDTIRSIIDQAQYKPMSNFRIFVFDECHALTSQSWNAFLKILEEPPKQSIFILCTTEPTKIPPAIASRATKLPLQLVPSDIIAERLKYVLSQELKDKASILSDENIMKLADAAQGHPRNALTSLEMIVNAIMAAQFTNENIEDYLAKVIEETIETSLDTLAMKFLLGCYSGKYTTTIMALKGVDNFVTFMDLVIQYHINAIYKTVSPKLMDMCYKRWYGVLEDKGVTLDPLLLSDMNNILMDTSNKLKTYAVDPFFTCINAGLLCVSLFKKAKS